MTKSEVSQLKFRPLQSRSDRAASPTGCDEKVRLLRRYDAAVREYSRAVSDLMTTVGLAEFENAIHCANLARAIAQEAHEDLDRHLTEHEC
jgi:hypothetical protein